MHPTCGTRSRRPIACTKWHSVKEWIGRSGLRRRELQEFDAGEESRRLRGRERRRAASSSATATRVAAAVHPFVEPDHRAHAVDRDLPRRAGAELVAEDLVGDHAVVAGVAEPAQELRHRVVALSREAAVVAAELEQVHRDVGRVGELDERDLPGRDLGHRREALVGGSTISNNERRRPPGKPPGLPQRDFRSVDSRHRPAYGPSTGGSRPSQSPRTRLTCASRVAPGNRQTEQRRKHR